MFLRSDHDRDIPWLFPSSPFTIAIASTRKLLDPKGSCERTSVLLTIAPPFTLLGLVNSRRQYSFIFFNSWWTSHQLNCLETASQLLVHLVHMGTDSLSSFGLSLSLSSSFPKMSVVYPCPPYCITRLLSDSNLIFLELALFIVPFCLIVEILALVQDLCTSCKR